MATRKVDNAETEVVVYRSALAALAARAKKPRPTSWYISSDRSGYVLIKIKGFTK